MSEPTKAAMKAAETHFGHKVCKPNASEYVFVERLAKTIDRETGLPSVLWALKIARDVLADPASMDNRFMIQSTIGAIDEALRKAGEL